MATNTTKKATNKTSSVWPKITQGSHSTRTEHEDGRVDFVTHWDELVRDVSAVLSGTAPTVKKAPAKRNLVKETETKVKATRAKKTK